MEKRQLCGNVQAPKVGGKVVGGDKGTDDNNNKTTINKSAVAEADAEDSWRETVYGSGGKGATVVQRWRRNSFAMRSWIIEV